MPISGVQQTMNSYHARVLAMETDQMREMARRWLGVEASLDGRIAALSMQIAMLHKDKHSPYLAEHFMRLEQYQALLGQVRVEIKRYNAWAADLITQRQGDMAKLGIQGAQAAIDATYREAGVVKADYHRLPVKAVEEMIGLAGDGSPLSNLFKLSFPETALQLTQALVNATAQGDNPRETARLIRDGMSGNLQRALVIARTEQLRAFRSASMEQMKESGVVDGWIWRSALQDRTCPACLAMDGTEHTFDEQLDDHPQGRCWMQPMIKGMQPVQAESGKDWFERQDEATQRSILGAAKYEAWKGGKFDFLALAGRRQSNEWGTTVMPASLKDLVGEEGVKIYAGQGEKIMGSTWYQQVESGNLGTVEEARRIGESITGWALHDGEIRQLARDHNVIVLEMEKTIGLWGSPEPSFRSTLDGSKSKILSLSKTINSKYSQDAVALLIPQKNGEGGILSWDFEKKLSNQDLNMILEQIQFVNQNLTNKNLNFEIGVTIREGGYTSLEFWFSNQSIHHDGMTFVEIALEEAGISFKSTKTELGYEFILVNK